MQQRHRGFSLMESLVTLLVFSIAMLGLGQLQARLWVSSGDIHRANQALLIAENVTELLEINTLISQKQSLTPTIPPYRSLPGFNYEQSVFSAGLTATTEVRVLWQRPSGADSISFRTSFSNSLLAEDADWLLPKS
jgi:prepilin-type N-terminal cleavage/methylation domain-containing protein